MPAESRSRKSVIPSVDRLLRRTDVLRLIDHYGRPLILNAIRSTLAAIRRNLSSERQGASNNISESAIISQVTCVISKLTEPSLVPVFNLTGTILHTGLGRASLPEESLEAVVAAMGACNLEYDLDIGSRGDRDSHLNDWLCRLTEAEAATVVNNNAAAVLLTLHVLAPRKKVLISRGELIEIGGSFRLPAIMTSAGCELLEVGTTNRTHAQDFEKALGPEVAMIMKVHTSNYKIQGFTTSASIGELKELARAQGIPLVVDLGSGALVDLDRYGLPHEPTPRETLHQGADLVTFSGDKLLGGPQSGIIVGRKDLVAKIKNSPMKRAMRLDKIATAILASVLRLYADPDRLADHLPLLRTLVRSQAEIEKQARRLVAKLGDILAAIVEVEVRPCRSQIGGGSLPTDRLESFCLALSPKLDERSPAAALDRVISAFRGLKVPVIGRIKGGALLLDLRALEDEEIFINQLQGLANRWENR